MVFTKRIQGAFTLKTVAEMLAEEEEKRAFANTQLAAVTTPPQNFCIPVGKALEAEYFGPHTGISIEGGVCIFTEYLLDRHFMLIGEIGSGKTTAIKTLSQQILTRTERDVFILNFKGQRDDDEDLRRILAAKRPKVKVVRLDPDNPGFPYNPFKYGDALSLSNRWARAFGIERTVGRADEYYGDVRFAAILLINYAEAEPARSIAEFRRRMEEEYLRNHYPSNHPLHNDMLMVVTAERGKYSPLQHLQVRAVGLFLQLERFFTEDGWTPEEGSAIISVPASKIPDTAKALAGIIVEDFKHFMSARQKRPCQIFWDEFQAAGNESITELLSQSRSFNCGVVLATQDINKLGDELQQKKLTSDTTTLISFRTQQSAGFVAKMSGTVKKARVTMQIEEGVAATKGTVGEDEDYRIHPNDIAQLPDGFCYILKNRTFAKVKFNMPDIPANVSPEPIYIPQPKPVYVAPAPTPTTTQPKPPVTKRR